MVHPHDIFSSVEPWTRRIRSFAGELAKKGHQVRLVYFPLAKDDTEPRTLDDYEVIPFRRSPSPVVFMKNILRLSNLALWAEVVHFQKAHYYASVPTVIAAYIKGKPLHYDWDDWEEMIWYESCGKKSQHFFTIGYSFRILERTLPVLADTVSVASQHLRDLALRFGVKKENIYSAPVGAELEIFNPGIDGSRIKKEYNLKSPLVLYVGQLHGAQYIDLFIKAANIVLHKKPEVTFMIVGEGFMERQLKNLTIELGIEDKIIFTGSVTHHKIPEYIAAADVCVAPFKDTPVTRCKSPLKIVEYMASGKAIVASNVGEVRRMLGGVGILTPPGDFHAIAEGVLRLLRDDKLRGNLGRFARKRAEEKYNWKMSADNLLTAYEKIR